MEIAGNLLNADHKQRLDQWQEEHFYSFAGFQDDPELAPNEFRTAGDVLYLASDYYKRCFGKHGPPPDLELFALLTARERLCTIAINRRWAFARTANRPARSIALSQFGYALERGLMSSR